MIRIILAALRAHPAQALTIGLLAAVAAGLSAILPTYLVGAVDAGTQATVDAAPLSQRLITVTAVVPARSAVADAERRTADARRALERPGIHLVTGMRAAAQLTKAGTNESFAAVLAHREDVCAHLRITGSCPAGDHDALVSNRDADRLGLQPGTELRHANSDGLVSMLTVTGVYQTPDVRDPYWTGGTLVRANPVFVIPAAFTALAPAQIIATAEGLVTAALFADFAPKSTTDALVARFDRLEADNFAVYSPVVELGNRVTTNRQLLITGVPVAGVQMLLLCWLTLGLALRHAGAGWRADAGLLKLRGAPSRRILALAVGRSAVPILAGAVVGAAVAVALIVPLKRLLSTGEGPSTLAVTSGELALVALGAAVLAVLGSLAVAAVAERRVLKEPVLDLMRRVPQRRRGWRAGALEVVVAVLAVAAIYQVRSAPEGAEAVTAGLALFVPVLVALAVAVTGTRLSAPVAAMFARRAFGGGRVSTGLAVLDLARRPSARRLAALLVVAVALLVTAGVGWSGAAAARDQRASLDLGAPRVISVVANGSTHLLSAVRAADPSGRSAMAVVAGRLGAENDAPPVVAVDTSRLAAVGGWNTAAARAALARRAHPDAPPTIMVAGAAVEVDLTVPERGAVPSAAEEPDDGQNLPANSAPGGAPGAAPAPPSVQPPIGLAVVLDLVDARGAAVAARFGPLPPGRQTVRVDTPACAGAGCRLVSITLVPTRPMPDSVAADTAETPATAPIVLHRLAQLDPPATLVDQAGFADLRRWRQPVANRRPALVFSRTADGLSLRISALAPPPPVPAGQPRPDNGPPVPDRWAVEVADAPLPLPAVATGITVDVRAGGVDYPLLSSSRVPVRAMATGELLPRVGERGMLVDLEYADRLVRGLDGAQEVWLTRDAPSSLLDRLRDQGLQIIATDSTDAATGRFAAQGGTAVLRLYLVVALAGLLLAAGAVVLVGVVDRPTRAAELAALRVQGVPEIAVRRSVRAGYAVAVAVAVALGVLAALVVRRLAGAGLPLFDDEWDVIAPPGPSWLAIGLLAAGLAVAFWPAVLVASARGKETA